MRLVDDQGFIRRKERIAASLGEEYSIGHHLYSGVALALIGEADLAADLLSPGHTKLLRDATGYRERGDSTRLRAPHLSLQAKPSL